MHGEPLIAYLSRAVGLPFNIDASNAHVATAILVVILLGIGSAIAWLSLRRTERRAMPSRRANLPTMFEITVEAILGFMEGMMGKDARRYLPFIGSLFIYIFACNMIGAVPGFSPPTANISTSFACAICVFAFYNYMGIRKHGVVGYLRHMAGPVIWLAPLMFTIELISHMVRPVSLSVRLFGNMTGDHMVLEIFSDVIPFGVPVIFLGFTIFVAFIQAVVFSLLSIMYIVLATQTEAHEEV